MLKIEVIKFEAQDIITTSGNPVIEDTPVAPKEDKCTCPDDRKEDGSYNEAAGRCEAAGHPGCNYPAEKGHNCEYIA